MYLLLFLLLVAGSVAAPVLPMDQYVLSLQTTLEGKEAPYTLHVVVMPILYNTTTAPSGEVVTEEEPLQTSVDVVVKKGDSTVDQCTLSTTQPYDVGGKTYYVGECSIPVEEGCYEVEARAVIEGREVTATRSLCAGASNYMVPLLDAFSLTNPNFFLQPQCAFFFFFLLLATVALSYRGIGIHKTLDLTYPKVPAKVFTFKYGYTIYHIGKELLDSNKRLKDVDMNLKRLGKLLGGRFGPIFALLSSDHVSSLIKEVSADKETEKILTRFLKSYFAAQHFLGKPVSEREVERLLREAQKARDPAGYLYQKALPLLHALDREKAMAYTDSRKSILTHLLTALGIAAVHLSSVRMANPKPKPELSGKMAKGLTNLVKKLVPGHQATALYYPLKQLIGDHPGEGLIALGRMMRSLTPGFDLAARTAYEKIPYVRERVQEAMRKESPSWSDRFWLAMFGYSKGYETMKHIPLENAEGLGESAFHELKVELGKVVAREHVSLLMEELKAKGMDLHALEEKLRTVEPENFHLYIEAFSSALLELQRAEQDPSLKEHLERMRDYVRALERAEGETAILQILGDWASYLEQKGADRDRLEKAMTLVEEAFTASQEFDTYLGKVHAIYETMQDHRPYLEELGLWTEQGGREGALQKFFVDVLSYMSLQKDRFSLSEALLATHVFLLERNFGLGKSKDVAEAFSHFLKERAKPVMGKEEAERLSQEVGRSIEKAYATFYDTVRKYVERKTGKDLLAPSGSQGWEERVVEFLKGGSLFGEVVDQADLQGLRAFYELYKPTFDVSSLMYEGTKRRKDWADAYQGYATAASPVLTAVGDAFGGTSLQPFSYAFASRLHATFSEQVVYHGRLLSSAEGKNRFERIASMLYPYLATAAYAKAYEELGYWPDRTIQKEVKDRDALIEKAREILQKATPEELINYLESIEWNLPYELYKEMAFLEGPEGAVPIFFSTEGQGEGKLPVILNREAFARLWKGKGDFDKEVAKKEFDVATKFVSERDRTFFAATFHYVDKNGRFRYLSLQPADVVSAHSFADLVRERGREWGLTDREIQLLERALSEAFVTRDEQGNLVSLFDRMRDLQQAIEREQDPIRREELRRELERLSRMPPTGHPTVDAMELVEVLRKVERAVVEGRATFGETPFGPRHAVDYEVFAGIVAALSVAHRRNLFGFLNNVVVGTEPSFSRQMRLSWKKMNFNVADVKDWVKIPFFIAGAVTEWYKYSFSRYAMALMGSTAYPNLKAYITTTKYRTTEAYIIENFLLGSWADYQRLLEEEARAELGYVPFSPATNSNWISWLKEKVPRMFRYFGEKDLYYRALLSEARRYSMVLEERLVQGTWMVPRNELLMAYHISPDVPHVGLATGYNMGPLVGYSKWYSEYIYNYFPIQKMVGSYSYRAKGWATALRGVFPHSLSEYLLRVGQAEGKMGKVKKGAETFLSYWGGPAFYYSFLGSQAPVLLPITFFRGYMGRMQAALIHSSLSMGMGVARARRMFSSSLIYPTYEDIVEEYDEKALQKLVDKMLRKNVQELSAKPTRGKVRSLLQTLSFLPPQERESFLSSLSATLQGATIRVGRRKVELSQYLLEEAERANLVGPNAAPPLPPMAAFPWLSSARPGSAAAQFYGRKGSAGAYAHLVGELIKGSFPLYMGVVAPLLAFGGVMGYGFLRYAGEAGKVKRLSSISAVKPAHWGVPSATHPFHTYEGVKLAPYHFRWYIPGIAGFYEKTIGHGYLHGLSWTMVPEPWVAGQRAERGSFHLLTHPLRPQYHGTNPYEIIARQQEYYRYYTSAENWSYAFLHPLFGISYLANKWLAPKREEAFRERAKERHYVALKKWNPYMPWQEKVKSLIEHKAVKTAFSLAGAAVATSSPLAFATAASLGISAVAANLAKGTVMGYCPKCGARKPKGEPCPVCGFKPFSPDF